MTEGYRIYERFVFQRDCQVNGQVMKKIVLIQPKVGYWESFQDAPLLPLALLNIAIIRCELCLVYLESFTGKGKENKMRLPIQCCRWLT